MQSQRILIKILLIVSSFPFLLFHRADAAIIPFKFLLVHDANASTTTQISYNIGRCLSDASIEFDLVDHKLLPDYQAEKFANYQAVIFLSEKSTSYAFAEDMLQYAKNGGKICVGIHDYNNSWLKDLGVTLKTPGNLEYLDCRGFKSEYPVFRQAHLDLPPEQHVSTALNLDFSQDWQILLRYFEPDQIMLASRKFGKGAIIFWNSSSLSEKPFRGLFLFSLFRQMPLAAFSVFNANITHIDDSPPPAYGIKEGPVARDLGMTDIQFHLKVWQKKVFDLLDDFELKPTHFVCLTYDDKISPPFAETVDREPFFSQFLEIAKKRGHQFSFHGYNHQSLTLGKSPSKPWLSLENMKASNQTALRIWNKYKLEPTLSYVPPNNVIDNNGKLSLIDGFPSIRVICRIYQDPGIYGNRQQNGYLIGAESSKFSDQMMKNIFSMYASRRAKSGGAATTFFAGDEFGSDPDVPQLLNLPRISSGYQLDGFNQLLILNGIMAHGIISHFFHPDDVFDPFRRAETWEKTYAGLRRLFIFFDKNAPFLRKIFTSKFLIEFKNYIYSETKISINSGSRKEIEISPAQRKFYYLFAGNSGKPELKNARIVSEIETGKIFLIEATGSNTIHLTISD
ncbi:MAG: DUF2194 domain-containing protein [Candidatus Rifleibacteriota bacterium]